jgi:hypothetical protein
MKRRILQNDLRPDRALRWYVPLAAGAAAFVALVFPANTGLAVLGPGLLFAALGLTTYGCYHLSREFVGDRLALVFVVSVANLVIFIAAAVIAVWRLGLAAVQAGASPAYAGAAAFTVLATFPLCAVWAFLSDRVLDHFREFIQPGQCPRCGYDLTGLPGHICPECGSPFSDQDARKPNP